MFSRNSVLQPQNSTFRIDLWQFCNLQVWNQPQQQPPQKYTIQCFEIGKKCNQGFACLHIRLKINWGFRKIFYIPQQVIHFARLFLLKIFFKKRSILVSKGKHYNFTTSNCNYNIKYCTIYRILSSMPPSQNDWQQVLRALTVVSRITISACPEVIIITLYNLLK